MKITGKEIYEHGNVLKNYVNNSMPTKVALSIAYNTMILEPLFKIVEQARINAVNEYGEKDSNGELVLNKDKTTVVFSKENQILAAKKIQEIFNEEFEIKDFKKVKFDDFMSLKEIKPTDVINLKFMIDEV